MKKNKSEIEGEGEAAIIEVKLLDIDTLSWIILMMV